EIAQALSRTAKPWFGNLEAMTWREVLTRLAERMAIGRDGAYEDGVWLDISWRQRFADALARAEARCADLDEGTFPSKLADIDLQQPAACIDALCAAWPAAETHRLHPLDARWFVDALCRRPGKPVPFVPVIDADVRRWYSSDSLWQSHDDRFTADQVLAIPGPIAVRGITRVDEPIGELLGRFAQHLVQTLDAPVSLVERSPRTFDVSAVVTRECTSAGWHVVVRDGAERWGDTLAGLPGPLVDALLARDGWVAGRLVPNPLVGLCAPVAGATLTVSEHGRRATWRCDDERVTLVLDGDSIRVCVCPRLAGASASWRLEAQLVGGAVVVDPDLTLPRFYADALFGGDLQPAPLFADAIETVTVDAEQAAAYARVTGRVDDRALPSDLVFSIAWRPMFAALSALPEGLLRLVHLSHGVEVGPAGLPAPGDSVTVSARLTKVEDAAKGRTIHAVATLDGGERATLRATFFVRGDFGRTAGLREGRPDTDRSNASVPTPGRTLATATDVAPLDPAVFARVGGDHNPIHVSPTLARFAGLGGPIVHGLWSAARATAFVVDEVADGDASRIASTDASFLNPVVPGASLELVAVRRAVDGGAQHVEVTLSADGTPAVQVRVVLRASRVAYVFPGQGIQRPGMGMDGLGRSRAARKVWETADRVTRDNLGFSLLRVVRENPVRIWLPDGPVRHPEGVLNLTQFTQVAMAVLAAAQVAELEEAGALVEDALFAGHSVGEYAALSGYSKVLPLESVVQLVWRRGLTMHSLVPRDAAGESGWRMGVIRPQYARLDAPEVDALVDQVRADTGAFVEIVNYNVRGRQYAATGRKDALAELERRLMARQTGKKTPWVEVPGIDVPFHSSALVPGVDAFRENLEEWLPETMAVHRLAHRYIPNLVARPFELTREFAASILEVADSAVVRDLLERWDAELERPDRLARTLLVELLAWQFASPVRWIETQDLLLNPTWAGGLGVDAIVEVGVGYQPTLSNMAKQTRLALGSSLPVYNLEADRDAVLFRDSDAAPEAPAPAPAPAAAPQADAAPAPVAAPVSRGPVAPPPDVTPDVSTALRWVLAVQAKRRLDQLDAGETLEEVFDGVSSRVNQVLLDLGAELGSGPVDGAAQLTLGDLATQLGARARYRGPGPYRTARHDAACTQVLGPAGWTKRSLEDHLADRYGFGPGLVAEALDVLVLDCRDGKSTRGGDLGALPGRVADATEAKALARSIAEILGERHGFALPGDGGGAAATAVDAEALNALRDELLGADGLLTRTAAVLGRTQTPEVPLPAPAAAASILDPEVERALQPAFDAGKHVVLDSGWAWAHRDVVALVSEGGDGERLVAWGGDTPVGRTAAWYAARADGPVAATLQRIAAGGERPAVSWTPVRPGPDGDRPDGTRASFVDALTPRDCGVLASDWRSVLAAGADTAWDFSGRTALVTGAGPGGIATAVVRHLLRGGARVIVTTSSYRRARIDQYRSLYANNAGPGAELHVVPFNQASMADVDALTAWCAAEDLLPDLLLPFAAVKDLGTLDTLGPRAEVVLRAMLLGPERLLGRLAATFRTQGRGDRLQVLVPLSPNLGTFGGDGMYGETKAGLETLAAKWSSEHNAWGRHTALVPVRIGWVRGTALMDGNDAAAWHLEERTGARTWSSDEMGFMLAALCVGEVRAAAAQAPLQVDLTAGLGDVADLSGTMDAIRADLQAPATDTVGPVVHALPSWEPVTVSTTAPVRDGGVSLDRMVVICGFGEVGPWGSSRTRWAREVDPHLPPAAVLELAWTTGLVQFEAGQWVDVESGDPVPEHAIGDRYREAVTQRSGVRIAEPETVGYDPDDVPVLATAWLDRDFTFNVASADEARAFQQADPEHTRVHCADGQWSVTRTAGTQVRVPRRSTLSRRVIGQVPNGWDPTRFGVPDEMAERVDKAALFNLVSTVEAFLSAGLTPEELLQKVHPSRVGSTQGSGIGGADSLRRLYVDPVLDTDRQRDILQETLINVVASYAVQSYVGGYGPVSSPVAACATAAVSVEHGVEKILLGKADVVVAGGVDDISMSGATGFADMGATADSIVMAAKGLEPDEMSRSNDLRRGGFVESHGGGAALLVRGDVALRLGLPVFGVVAYAGTYTDGIHPSVPAPGLGALGCAVGGVHSPLGRALADHGLTADDVTVVSKHDTSTGANDPNEAELHQRIQGAIGRTPGNPLFVVSQKTLTGHAKGGAAAWQLHGLCQVIGTGQVPGNRNLHCVDPALQGHDHLLYTDRTLTLPHGARAGVLTSLGFGHVGAIVCIAHPDVWLEKVPLADRQAWATAAEDRLERSRRDHFGALLGEHALYTKPADRRLPDGVNEADLLLDPGTRLGADGRFARP
ncbi:MAG: fatty acid synthase, partial [Myxococcota bacterium]